MVKRVEQSSENAKKFSGIANLIVDKEIPLYPTEKDPLYGAEADINSINLLYSGRAVVVTLFFSSK